MLRVGLRCASANRLWRAPNPFFTMRWGKRLLSNQWSPISPQSSMEKIIELFSRPHAPPESVKPYVDSIDEKETLIALPTIITLMELFTVGSSRGGAVLQRSRAVDLFPIEDRLVDTTVSRLSEWTSSSIEDPVECETRFRYGVSVWLYTSRVSASPPSGDVFRRLKQEVLFPNLRQMKQSGTTPCDARDLYSLVVDCGVWGSVFFTLSSSLPKDCWLYVLKRYTDSLSRVQEGVTAQLENVNEQSEASLIDGMESLSLFMTLTERAVYPIYLQGASEAPTHAVLDRLHGCAWASLQVVERSFRASPAVVTAWAARYTAWLKMVHYTVEQWCVSVSAVYEERLGGTVRRILSLFVQLTFAAWEKVKLHFDDWCALSDVLEAADRLGCDTEQNEGDAASPLVALRPKLLYSGVQLLTDGEKELTDAEGTTKVPFRFVISFVRCWQKWSHLLSPDTVELLHSLLLGEADCHSENSTGYPPPMSSLEKEKLFHKKLTDLLLRIGRDAIVSFFVNNDGLVDSLVWQVECADLLAHRVTLGEEGRAGPLVFSVEFFQSLLLAYSKAVIALRNTRGPREARTNFVKNKWDHPLVSGWICFLSLHSGVQSTHRVCVDGGENGFQYVPFTIQSLWDDHSQDQFFALINHCIFHLTYATDCKGQKQTLISYFAQSFRENGTDMKCFFDCTWSGEDVCYYPQPSLLAVCGLPLYPSRTSSAMSKFVTHTVRKTFPRTGDVLAQTSLIDTFFFPSSGDRAGGGSCHRAAHLMETAGRFHYWRNYYLGCRLHYQIARQLHDNPSVMRCLTHTPLHGSSSARLLDVEWDIKQMWRVLCECFALFKATLHEVLPRMSEAPNTPELLYHLLHKECVGRIARDPALLKPFQCSPGTFMLVGEMLIDYLPQKGLLPPSSVLSTVFAFPAPFLLFGIPSTHLVPLLQSVVEDFASSGPCDRSTSELDKLVTWASFLQLVFHFENVKRRLCTLAVAKQVAGREGPVHLWGDGSFSSLHVPLTEKRDCLGEDRFLYDCLTKRSCARDALDVLVTSPSSEETTDVIKEILRLLSRILSADVL